MNDSKMEEALKQRGNLWCTAGGVSMLPLIRPQKDIIYLEICVNPPKKYDVVLYKRKSGQYVLHRIVGTCQNGYILCGDNQWKKEIGIQQEQILGVLKGFYRGERYISMDSKWCRIYELLWCRLIWMRRPILWMAKITRRIWGKWNK